MEHRHAYLIIAHNELGLLQKLVTALDITQNDIYIHFDKSKYTQEVRSITARNARLTIISEVAVRWGSYSMVRCEFALLKLALQTPHMYYHLLSGVDLPLKPAEEINAFFEASGKQFVQFTKAEFPRHCLNWVLYKHISSEKFRTGKTKLENYLYDKIDRIGVKVQEFLGRKKELHFSTLQKGCQWFSITEPFAKYLIEMENIIEEDFADAYIPDEIVVPTVFVNSPWLKDQAAPELFNDSRQSMRYIDWERGEPYIFRIGDFEELIGSGCMFARKFSHSVDGEIIDALFRHCTKI